MHPRKAEILKRLDETARVHDASLEHSLKVAANPGQFGWRRSVLMAAIVVPLTGVSAVLNDLSRVLITHSDDEAWDRSLPPSDPATND